MAVYVGIDYSYTSPAICVYEGNKYHFCWKKCNIYSLSSFNNLENFDNIHFSNHKEYSCQTERFDNIATWTLKIIEEFDPGDISIIGIEGYSMASKGKTFDMGENGGILKLRLFERAYKFDVVPPTVVKKFATGSGAGKKEKMYEQFLKENKLDLKKKIQPNRKLGSPTSDLIDAYYITKYFVNNYEPSIRNNS